MVWYYQCETICLLKGRVAYVTCIWSFKNMLFSNHPHNMGGGGWADISINITDLNFFQFPNDSVQVLHFLDA